jgi:hypothetical protein
MKEEEQLNARQRELSEQLMGRLVPGNDPTPHNSCLPDGKDPKEENVLTIYGDSNSIGPLPVVILKVGNRDMIAVHRVHDSDAVALSIDFRDAQNRILLRLNEDGVVNRSNLNLLHPSKHEFLIEDQYGEEFLRVNYVNPKVFNVSGKVIYCGLVRPIMKPNVRVGCADYISTTDHISTIVWFDDIAACPMPQ